MAGDAATIELSLSELRAVTGFAVVCARPALAIFERDRPDDGRARPAIEAAQVFAGGGKRTKAIRDSAWAAHRAAREARDAGQSAASEAARAAVAAVGDHYLAQFRSIAHPDVVDVLRRYPAAPPGGARAGQLLRHLDASLR